MAVGMCGSRGLRGGLLFVLRRGLESKECQPGHVTVAGCTSILIVEGRTIFGESWFLAMAGGNGSRRSGVDSVSNRRMVIGSCSRPGLTAVPYTGCPYPPGR